MTMSHMHLKSGGRLGVLTRRKGSREKVSGRMVDV